MLAKTLNHIRKRRAIRTRARIKGTGERPRLSVKRSNRFIYAQLIDDTAGKTLVSISSRAEGNGGEKKTEEAARAGQELAKRASALKIHAAVFDRGGYAYHGRVKALCDGARRGGLRI